MGLIFNILVFIFIWGYLVTDGYAEKLIGLEFCTLIIIVVSWVLLFSNANPNLSLPNSDQLQLHISDFFFQFFLSGTKR
jgi:hypothetical protein